MKVTGESFIVASGDRNGIEHDLLMFEQVFALLGIGQTPTLRFSQIQISAEHPKTI